ncbi:hypothetical protein OE766_24470 [Pararhizobium sp. YC-54]|nr:hypothetical protein [Pararhizobium sp. YC-54]MCW0001381.1 hypothetical protein [Pararhizobium sp. YC-54]
MTQGIVLIEQAPAAEPLRRSIRREQRQIDVSLFELGGQTIVLDRAHSHADARRMLPQD